MSRQTIAFLLAFTFGAWLAAACGPASKCSASTCEGCCDANGGCHNGDKADACGARGATCNVCSGGQVCAANLCSMPGGADAGTDAGTGQQCAKTTPACADTAVQALDTSKTTVAPGLITTAGDGTGFKSVVDSRAGGFQPTESFVYARFTATTLEKLPLSDTQANDSMDWDIAFRRFVIRLNGGDSGPSCVAAVTLPSGTTYESVTREPSGATYVADDFLSNPPSCSFQADGSGLGTSPNTALASYYSYTSCVAMSGNVFIVKTRDNKLVKLTVTTYYDTEASQTACNSGSPSSSAIGGTMRLRWAYLN